MPPYFIYMDNVDVLNQPLGLKNYADSIRMGAFKNESQFPYSGIWVFTGAQGSGKTLMLMHVVNRIHEMYPNCIIVSNISIFGIPCIPYKGIEDFDKYQNGADGIIFIIDEIQTIFNSLESKNMPPSTLAIWSQNRKNRRVILGTSQRFNRIAKGLREQTSWNIECKHPFLNLFPYRVLDGSDYDENGRYVGELHRFRYYIPKLKVMTMYNTLEVVRNDSPTDL